MKIHKLLLGAAICFSLTSCFKDEPLNAECDVEQAYVHVDDPTSVFFSVSDTLVNVRSDATEIVFEIKADTLEDFEMAPMFRLTEGAVIEPANGSKHDFSGGKSVAYKVTSQDGKWSKTYNVSFRTPDTPDEYHFEDYRLVSGPNKGQIYEWSDLTADGSWIGDWATGNPGFNISMGDAKLEDYPTVPVSDGYVGNGVKLTTRDTGPLGHLVEMNIAAGNLFIGYFDVSQALTNTLNATNFGRSFDKVPLGLTGWYKYRPGAVFTDKNGKKVEGRTDTGDIYAVLYRNHDENGNSIMLHGDDVLSSPYIVAVARVPELSVTDEWTQFDVKFDYKAEIDSKTLAERGYNLSVVFTSSIEGATFEGAIGSTLYVDEVKVICSNTTTE